MWLTFKILVCFSLYLESIFAFSIALECCVLKIPFKALNVIKTSKN